MGFNFKVLTDQLAAYGGSILLAIGILIAGIIFIKCILKLTEKALKKSKLDEAAFKFVLSLVKYMLIILLVVIILSALKVPTGPLVAGLGACGAAVALALKDSLANLAAGIMILFKTPFKKGDLISVGGQDGVVQTIDLFTTTLKTADNRTVLVPNGTVSTSVLVNSSTEPIRRLDLTFSISYEADIEKTKEVLLNVAEANENVLLDPAPFSAVAGHADNAITMALNVWVETAFYLSVKFELLEAVKLALDEAGIKIPYPQMDVHMVK